MASLVSNFWNTLKTNITSLPQMARDIARVKGTTLVPSIPERITENLAAKNIKTAIQAVTGQFPRQYPETPFYQREAPTPTPTPAPTPPGGVGWGGVGGGAGAGLAWDQMMADLGPAPTRGWSEEEARRIAEAEFGPYYDELLDDYLEGLGLKREEVTTRKEKTLARIEEDLMTAMRRAQEGYAERGLFFSGGKWGRKGAEQLIERGAERGRVDIRDWAEAIEKRAALEEEMKRKEITRARKEAIEQDVWWQEAREREKYSQQLREHYAPLWGTTV